MARRKPSPLKPVLREVTESAQHIHWWVMAIVGFAFAIWMVANYLGNFATASTVTAMDRRMIILETRHEDDSKRIDWLVETVGQLSSRQMIPVSPPPPRHNP